MATCEWSKPLSEVDPEMYELIQSEQKRQRRGLELIASENFTSRAVLDCLGSCLTNKYAEGYPGGRYYGGNEYIDKIENLCMKRALEAFHLDPAKWGVNVQPLSGSPANFEVYTALLQPHDRLMGLALAHGGHLTHGHMIQDKRISATSIFWESIPYFCNQETGLVDYDDLEKMAKRFFPKLIVAGYSAYPRNLDFERFRKICDGCGAIMMTDMAHFSGLVAAGELPSPFDYSDIVTTTTHKTLRGPRGGIIFYRKGVKSVGKDGKEIMYDYEQKIKTAVFPALQGGPHENVIAGIATALSDTLKPEWKTYAKQVKVNCRLLGEELMKKGYKLVSNGTDNHLILVDLKPFGIDGSRAQEVMDKVHITLNKNTVPGDDKPLVPGGVRIGSAALTTRGMKEEDFKRVAEFLDRGFKATKEVVDSNEEAKKTMKAFKETLNQKEWPVLVQLAKDVEEFSLKFPMP